MALIRDPDSKRLHIESKLMGESLVSKSFLEKLEDDGNKNHFRLFPNVSVLKIGGQSITDIGSKALFPIIQEIGQISPAEKMVITTGGGTRSRHIYTIALELGMPTGIIAKLSESISEQNALMISTLLSPYGGIHVGHDDVVKLNSYLNQGCIPVMQGMPAYGYWEKPPKIGRLPLNRTDVGTFLLAEVIGAKQCIFIKDVNGLYTDDPKKDPDATFIPKIGAQELLDSDQDDIVVERAVLECLVNARGITSVQIINGTVPGNIRRALKGEHVGTIIHKDS